MIKVEQVIIIRCPVKEVFDFFADRSRTPEWQDSIKEAGFIPGNAPSLGAEFFEKRTFMGWQVSLKYKITRYEPNKLVAWKIMEGPISGESSMTFEVVDGGTKVCLTVQWELRGYLHPMEERAKEELRSRLADWGEQAKKKLEC